MDADVSIGVNRRASAVPYLGGMRLPRYKQHGVLSHGDAFWRLRHDFLLLLVEVEDSPFTIGLDGHSYGHECLVTCE